MSALTPFSLAHSNTTVRHDHTNQGALQAITVHKRLHYILRTDVDILDLLRRDVLALLELEYVLDTVNNLQAAILEMKKDKVLHFFNFPCHAEKLKYDFVVVNYT